MLCSMTPAAIKDLRTAEGLSQQAFANRVGVTRLTVINWETGKRPPSATHLAVLVGLTQPHPRPVAPVAKPPADDDQLSLTQCAEALGLKPGSDRTLRNAIKQNTLSHTVRLGYNGQPQYFVRRADLLRWHGNPQTFTAHRDPRGAAVAQRATLLALVTPSSDFPLTARVFDAQDVRAIRQALHLTQAAFADAVGVKVNTVKQWEGGRYAPSTGYQQALRTLVAGAPALPRPTPPPPAPAPVTGVACIWVQKTGEPVVSVGCCARRVAIGMLPPADETIDCIYCGKPVRVQLRSR